MSKWQASVVYSAEPVRPIQSIVTAVCPIWWQRPAQHAAMVFATVPKRIR